MDDKYINAFLNSAADTFSMFGIEDLQQGEIHTKDNLHSSYDITVVTGFSEQLKGNISYNMSEDTAKGIASVMMMGMEINELNDMSKSAISELANMISGGAATRIAEYGLKIDITPPSVIHGRKMRVIISQVETIAVELITSIGKIEFNIGLEV